MLYLFEHNTQFPIEVHRILSNLKNICRTTVSDNSYLENENFLGSFIIKSKTRIELTLYVLWMMVLMEKNDPLGNYLYLELEKTEIFKILSPTIKIYYCRFLSDDKREIDYVYYVKDIDPDDGKYYYYPINPEKYNLPRKQVPYFPQFEEWNEQIRFYKEVPRTFDQVLSLAMQVRGLTSEREVLSQLAYQFTKNEKLKYKFIPRFASNRKPREVRRIGVGYRDKGSLRDISEQRNFADTSKEHWIMLNQRKRKDLFLKTLKEFFGLGP